MNTTTQRLTITVDADLIEAGHRAVEPGRAASISGWVSRALREMVHRDRKPALLASAVAG
ncbi:MAG: hypothetical protein AB1673_10995 [Actinomycetota bacterium]